MTLSKNKQSWIAASLFILLAFLALFDPLPEPALTIAQAAIFFPTAIWAVYISYTSRDEVMVHASRAAFAHGVPISVGVVIVTTMIMRFWPPATSLVTDIAARTNNNLPDAAIGFGMGVVFTLVTLGATILAVYAIWWARKR